MKKTFFTLALAMLSMVATAQTVCVESGGAVYAFTADNDDMTYTHAEDGSTTLTIQGKAFNVTDIKQIVIDEREVTASTVSVTYAEDTAQVIVAGDIAPYVTATVSGAHVKVVQSNDLAQEITYNLKGSSADGEFYMEGSYKATVALNGLTLTNPSGSPLNIMNGKRIELSAKNGTVNTLTDGASGSQKACIYCKGHLELKGKGTLNVYANAAHAIKSAEYMQMKNLTVNVLSAAKDGISCDEYFLVESGTLNISGTSDDAIQCDIDGKTSTGETKDHEDEDSGNIYILDGTVTLNVTGDAAKGMKAAGDISISGGKVTVTQTGNLVAETDDLSYPTSIKCDGNINITGGTITIDNTASGGKGMSADGAINIDESKAKVIIDITANGEGGIAEVTSSGETTEPAASYKVYVSLPTTGGGGPGGGWGGNSAWTSLYLYKSDGTLVQQLTSTESKSNGYNTVSFYYYDFKTKGDGTTYYFKSNDYNSRNTTYAIRSAEFEAPTSGNDIYYSITNSYQTSGQTRIYTLSNVTSTYSGSADLSEDEGTSYNAVGIKADGALTISGGTITVKNSGAMSKSMKSKATLTIDGGDITLTPSGEMKVVNNDASYSSAIKAVDFVQNDGTVTINASGQAGRGVTATNITTNGGTLNITNSGAGVQGSSDSYTAKGMKADTKIALNAGTITIKMSGSGGKGIKSKGTYTQGTTDGDGPTLVVSTTGSSLGSSSGGGGGMGPGGGGFGQTNNGSSAKAIKVQGTIIVYGGTTEVSTSSDGAEGLESKTAIYIEGGQHYYYCYDDCINSSGAIYFNGGVTVCYSNGNDAVDSNYGRSGAITIGDGVAMAYTSKGSPEEGFDCDNNSYIQITGNGIGISAGGSQGGGGGFGGSSSTISNAKQGYYFYNSSNNSLSYKSGQYYTLADADGNNLVTYSFLVDINSTLSLFTAKGMVKGSSYTVRYSKDEPTDATTSWHGIYLGSTHSGTSSLTSFTAQ